MFGDIFKYLRLFHTALKTKTGFVVNRLFAIFYVFRSNKLWMIISNNELSNAPIYYIQLD